MRRLSPHDWAMFGWSGNPRQALRAMRGQGPAPPEAKYRRCSVGSGPKANFGINRSKSFGLQCANSNTSVANYCRRHPARCAFLCLLASLSTGCSGTADACVGRMQATREYCIEVAEPRRTADGQAVYSTCWSFSRVTPRLAHKRGLLEWRTLVGSDLRVPRRLPLTLARYHVMPRSGCLLLFEYSAIIEITSQMSSGATQSARASLSLLKNACGPA